MTKDLDNLPLGRKLREPVTSSHEAFGNEPKRRASGTSLDELIARAVEAMREDPFMDDIGALGTTAQDDRMTHYATIAFAAFEGRPAPTEVVVKGAVEHAQSCLSTISRDTKHVQIERAALRTLLRFATDTTPSRATEAAQIYADFHGEDASYRPECAAKLAALASPSRDEEGSVDREAIGPVEPNALAASIVELEDFERRGKLLDEIENWAFFGESVMLCLHELKRLLALKTSTPETQTVEGCAFVPPPHWTPVDKYDRHPKTAEQWDSRNDPTGERQALAVRRLNFAADLADPRAPDQMALVHRGDLIDVLGQLVWRTAQSENRREQLERAKPTTPERSMVLEEAALLDALRENSWDLRCFDRPTGGGDADIGWRVVGHWQAEPHERTIAEVYEDDPRAAIRAAISAPATGCAADA